MKDHDPVCLLEHRAQILVQVLRSIPALARSQERRDHVRLHRPRTEQRDIDDEVAERLRRKLADEFALARRLDLKTAERAGRPDEIEGLLVIKH